jgi:hypothetical protein
VAWFSPRPVSRKRGRYRAGQLKGSVPEILFYRKHCKLQCVRVIGTVVFRSGSLVAAPCHQKPSAVWLLGARPSENTENTAPGGTREPNSSKTLRVLANSRHPKIGAEIIRIHNSLVQYGFGETSCLTKRVKTSYRATFLRTAAGTQTLISQGNHQNTSCSQLFRFRIRPLKKTTLLQSGIQKTL